MVIAIDTETTNEDLRDGRGHALGLSMAYKDATGEIKATYFPIKHYYGENVDQEVYQKIREVIVTAQSIVFHNAKFDLASLATIGINYDGVFYDTMLMAHMVDENFWSKGLDALVKSRLGIEGKKRSEEMQLYINVMGWKNVTPELIYRYAATDAEITLMLFYDLILDLAAEGLAEELWDYEQEFTKALGAMERRGILIDQDLCKAEALRGEVRMAEIVKELGFNPGSTKDLERVFIDTLNLPVIAVTPKGKPSFNRKAMESYDILLENLDSPLARLVLEYRGWQKTVSSNYKAYLDLVSPDGRLRPNYKIHGTVTGRLSCEKPNLQQIPRSSANEWNGKLKAAFIPSPEFTLMEFDYSQVEFRLAAAYAKESALIEIFNSGEDIFTNMASQIGMQRQQVKTLTYATLYGGGLSRLSFLFNCSTEDAAVLRDMYFTTYPGLKRVAQEASGLARRNKYVKYWSGRRRHFKFPQEEAHKAFNSIVQGGAAEVTKRAIINCHNRYLGNPDCRMLLTVHDSIIFEIRTDKVDEYSPEIIAIMEQPAGVPDFGVRLEVQGKEWGN